MQTSSHRQHMKRERGRAQLAQAKALQYKQKARTTSLLAPLILLLEGTLMLLPLCFFVLQIGFELGLHLPQVSATLTARA